ncbi:MAG TPA: acyltransferase family protein [Ilumatobacteraceae bacterium]|nr:acyltransferase family protein [Ilumatobacteraceae bacterium]
MTTSVAPSSPRTVDRLPYLPGLDGLRALAVIAVMIYHANHLWLSGGFLGVEVFFVISGYLITLLLIGEFERDGRIKLGQFWRRRFRRLLPPLFVMLAGLAIFMTIFRRTPMGRTRGDFAGGILYSSNWYQIVVGQGYTANEAFVPLRHLWSLAVEEQFYLIWPLVMVAVLLRWSGRALPRIALWLVGISVGITVVTGLLFSSGDVAATCTVDQRQGYWTLFGRCININEALYLGTFSRAGGLLLGAAFAMVWRPSALMRGRFKNKAILLDGVGVIGIVALGWLMTTLWLSENGHAFGVRFDSALYRGGFFVTGVATLAAIAGVTHQRSALGRILGIPVINWVGTRSYGLYLFHWPIYQIIRGEAGQPLSISQFVLAIVLTIPITEASYRFVEMPIRQGRLAEILHDRRRRTPDVYKRRRRLVGAAMAAVALVGFAGVSIAMAPNRCVGQVECDLAAASAQTDPAAAPDTPPTATTTPVATPDGTTAIPQTTESTTSTSSTTSTTLPVDQRPPMAIGESVMLGAKPQLEAKGFVVDAAESRQGKDLVKELVQLRAAGRLGNKVVIHIGTNGEVSDETFGQIMANLPPEEVKAVCFLTVKADRPWIEGNNGRIVGLQSQYPNVHVGYWADLVPTEGMASDGIHFKSDAAKEFYAGLISAWTTEGPCV